MFGYVIPDKMNMYMKDFYVYKAHYCGLCKAIGKNCSELMRFSTNYDLVLLDLLVHDLLDIMPTYKNEPCILSPKKKSIAKPDSATFDVVDINTLLMYYKLVDDKEDSKNKSLAKSVANNLVVKSHYKKAKERHPFIDELYKNEYGRLRKYEKEKESSIDKIADPFATMLSITIEYLLKDKCTSDVKELMYNLGKWIYIIDAIDDVDKDFKNGEFNPFLIGYNYVDLDNFFVDNLDRMKFLLMSCYNKMCDHFANIKLNIYEGPITNIIWYGILYRTEDILGRKCECKKIRI